MRLVSKQRLGTMTAIAFTAKDEVMGFPASWAFGYSPDRPGGVPSRHGSTFGLAAVTRIDRLIAEQEEHR